MAEFTQYVCIKDKDKRMSDPKICELRKKNEAITDCEENCPGPELGCMERCC